MIVGEFIADFCESPAGEIDIPTALVREAMQAERAKLDALLHGGGPERADALKMEMQQIMTDRSAFSVPAPTSRKRCTGCRDCWCAAAESACRYRVDGPNPELVTAYRTQKMLKVALCVANGALARTESRGAHFREDHPRRDDSTWLKRTLATWKDPRTRCRASITSRSTSPRWSCRRVAWLRREELHRHPDTARRAEEITALRERMKDSDRHDVQGALMPYEHMLPARFRGLNERIDEKLP